MKISPVCVICGSADLVKKFGQFAPFVAHRLFDYPICKVSLGGEHVFPTTFTNALRCRDCGFVFSQMRPDEDELARLYSGYRDQDYVRERDIFEPGHRFINPLIGIGQVEIENRQKAMAEFLGAAGDFASVRRLLDYGGDQGQHIPRLFTACEKIVYDISAKEPVAGVRAVRSLDEVGDVDFLIMSNVLEHVSYPAELLGEAAAVLAPGGRLFIDVPLEMSAEAEIAVEEIPASFHEHINYFTPRSLTRLLERGGFALDRIAVADVDYGWIAARPIFALAAKSG